MQYKRMPIEIESPEEMGYENILYNLAESSVRDRSMADIGANLNDLVLNYGDHKGLSNLRESICKTSFELKSENVLVCQAAAMALFIVNSSLLSKDDHLIVIRPNYATNIETARAIGCEISIVDLTFESEFQLNLEAIKQAFRPNTKLISITTPHNPTGVEFDSGAMDKLIAFAEEMGCYLLIDETYRELNFRKELKPYFAEKSKNVISISSLSKAYGFPGLRIGWIISLNTELLNLFLAAKEQIIICNSVVDEYLAFHVLKNKEKFIGESHNVLNNNFKTTKHWIENHQYLEWIEPTAGAVSFIRFKEGLHIDFVDFYKVLFEKYKTLVGPGHWFEQSDRYFRLGFGFPTEMELVSGLKNIDSCLAQFCQNYSNL